ncbi:hypothetical protein [Anabaena catenula]|uniref:Methyl-accepting chemotaxis protein n=1 Tax=Anabaena catenula FACHB-362 TaxID=2692877 RepID=A0ABR8JA05_9NOST|nr:hypothetical protein [Anabaena catenula]MBD2694425.1 hypothetical protein [Anabaena catenula FACHB-362]
MTSQRIETTNSPPVQSVISVSPQFQERLLEQMLLQSGGISIGIIMAMVGSVVLAKYLGVGELIAGAVDRVEKGTESLKEVSKGLSELVCDISEAHRANSISHENIINKVETVIEKLQETKELVKDVQRRLDK